MENPLKFIEPIIRNRIDVLNETLERSVEVAEKVIENEQNFQILRYVLSDEHVTLLLDIYANYCFQIVDAEDTYYRRGFVDGMQLQQGISAI